MTTFNESRKLLSNTQYSSRPKLSTEAVLTTVINKLYMNMDEKKFPLITLYNLSKPLDSLKHNVLNVIDKLLNVNMDSS